MSTKVELCNRALLLCKQPTINELTAANQRAVACQFYYPPALKELLEGTPWDFATLTVPLVAHATEAPEPWGYRFQMPTLPPVMTPRELLFEGATDEDPGLEYEIQPLSASDNTLTILANESAVQLRYTYFHDDPTKYPAMFDAALVARLAMDLDIALNKSSDQAQQKLQAKALYWLGEAQKNNKGRGYRVRPDCGAVKARR